MNWRTSGSATAALSEFRENRMSKILSQWNQKESAINVNDARISLYITLCLWSFYQHNEGNNSVFPFLFD